MIKAIVNAPFGHTKFNVGSMLYCLAHEAERDESYRFYMKTRSFYGSREVILDNGADELGEGRTGDALLELVQEIQPTELILPDVLGDGEKTFRNSYDFYKNQLGCTVPEDHRLMGVPQGSSFEEYISCFEKFFEYDFVDVLGVPYDIDWDVPLEAWEDDFCTHHQEMLRIEPEDTKTAKRSKRRLVLIAYLATQKNLNCPIHLLGMNSLWELEKYRDYKIAGAELIRSTDTTAPFAAAKAGREWTWTEEVGGWSYEKDWPALDFKTKFTQEEHQLALKNLWEYIRSCGDVVAASRFGAMSYEYDEL